MALPLPLAKMLPLLASSGLEAAIILLAIPNLNAVAANAAEVGCSPPLAADGGHPRPACKWVPDQRAAGGKHEQSVPSGTGCLGTA